MYIAGENPGEVNDRTVDAVPEAGAEKHNVCEDVWVVIQSGESGDGAAGAAVEVAEDMEGNASRFGAVGVALGTRNPMTEVTGKRTETA